MKKVVLSVVAALAVSAAVPAFAADMPVKAAKAAPAAEPSPWDIAFGAAIMNDYMFRGVTQSGHKPSVAAYFEPRYNINSNFQLYAGLSGESIKFANNAAAEIDFYGGVRPTFGPLAFDFGFWYYYYPGGNCYAGHAWRRSGLLWPPGPEWQRRKSRSQASTKFTARSFTPRTDWAFGGNFYYSPNFLNTGAEGEYLSGTIKFTAPRKWRLVRSAGTCRVSSAVSGWAPAICSTPARSGTRRWLCDEQPERHQLHGLQYLERRFGFDLEGLHPRSALQRHESQQG